MAQSTKDRQAKARTMGVDKVYRALQERFTRDAVNRWMNGGVNGTIDEAFREALPET